MKSAVDSIIRSRYAYCSSFLENQQRKLLNKLIFYKVLSTYSFLSDQAGVVSEKEQRKKTSIASSFSFAPSHLRWITQLQWGWQQRLGHSLKFGINKF